MPRSNSYSTAQRQFLQREYPRLQISELTAAFNKKFRQQRTEGAIKSACKRYGYTSNRKRGLQKGESTIFSTEQIAYIKKMYVKHPAKELIVMLNERFNTGATLQQLKTFVKNHKITSGRTGHFVKGQESWNKGVKGYMGANRTSFKKGSQPSNTRQLGAERICSKDGFILVKIEEENPYTGAKTRFRHKHVHLWEQHHGPVPQGHVVSFIDGDKMNCDISNLELITRQELLQRNRLKLSEYPPQLRPQVKALAKLETVRFEKSKKCSA